jgi:peptidyl-dipeptidase Dcp
MKKLFAFSIMLFAVSLNLHAQLQPSNPFYSTSTLPYQAPALDKIKNADIKAALEEGMKQQLAEIGRIADNPDAPTFDNTLTAFEKTGLLLQRARAVFQLLTGANSDPELLKIAEQEAPRFAANNDAIFLNGKLFKRFDALYNKRDQLRSDPESRRLLEYYKQQFDMAGATLPDSAKTRLREINQSLASLSAQFNSHLLAATKTGALLISDSSGLAGLSKGTRDAAAQAANAAGFPGQWLISLQNTTQQPDLQFLSDRKTRQRLFEDSWNRAEKGDSNDTRSIISRMAFLRAQRARSSASPISPPGNYRIKWPGTPMP